MSCQHPTPPHETAPHPPSGVAGHVVVLDNLRATRPLRRAEFHAVKLNVRENAYGFLNEALRFALRAWPKDDQDDEVEWDPDLDVEEECWRFAIVLAAQGIELLLKARLGQEHPLLVYRNPGRGGLTVGVDEAIERLARAGVALDPADGRALRSARELRNAFVHFEADYTVDQAAAAFAGLMEFAHVFHLAEFGQELHEHVDDELHHVEAVVIAEFRRGQVIYQGSEVPATYVIELVTSQFYPRIRVGDDFFDRYPHGHAANLGGEKAGERPCGDCMALAEQLHADGCDCETCPSCGSQMLGCNCDWEWEVAAE